MVKQNVGISRGVKSKIQRSQLNRIQAMFPFTYYKLKANTNLKKANLNLT